MRLSAALRLSLVALVALAATLGPGSTVHAQQVIDREKLAQTGFKFLSVTADARSAAMGGAATAREGGAEMMFSNPSGMAWIEDGTDVALSQTQWIADINHNYGSVAIRPSGGRWGVVGVSLELVDYGDLQETIRADNDNGYLDLGTFSPTAYAVGLGYARALSDRFSAGGQVKLAGMDFGDAVVDSDGAGGYLREGLSRSTLAYDFGVHYKTGFNSLNFAVSARNFAPEVTFGEESFQLPLTLQIGLAMDVLDLTSLDPSMHSLMVTADAANPRDFSEQIRLGGEYTFMNTLALRGGYVFPSDSEGLSLGAGVRQRLGGVAFGADYAYSDAGIFSGVHRIAIRFAL